MDNTTAGKNSEKLEVAVLAGGCFWCLEAVFDQVTGVSDVVSGYAGGNRPNPTYEQVCNGDTGHAEVVKVTFDPDVISYEEILGIFFSIHDPTTLNRQGADVGTQYRSAIFYTSSQQKDAAEAMLQQLAEEKVWDNPVVTEIKPLDVFFPAEDYHQEYFARNPYQGYCQFVVAPKVNKFKKKYAHLLKGK
ncbi:MAG TPA: peptide-methionine (S)-S-oxide reductase MsrA [Anaerolineaceae bacterium]|nr:peptide-methionine (S)-S-oxide reductase MsrA [Anaerolineaceae bacterium]